jgi:hypothetical protein
MPDRYGILPRVEPVYGLPRPFRRTWYGDRVVALQPVSRWGLDDLSGNLSNQAGGDVLTAAGGLVYRASGISGGYSVTFNGSTGCFTATSVTALPSGSAARAIVAWFKTTSTSKQCLFSYGTRSTTRAWIALLLNDQATNRFTVATWSDDPYVGLADLNNGQWHMAAYVNLGTVAYRMYMDGALVLSGNHGGVLATGATSGTALGREAGASQSFVNGNVDEVSVFDRALTAAEIASLWGAGRTQV